jgi:hypothetical protein
MPANYVLLERIELNASAASVTFANIPQTGYTDLKVVLSTRNSVAAVQVTNLLKLNALTTGYADKYLYGSGSAAGSGSLGTTSGFIGDAPGASATASTFGNQEIYIPNYTSSNAKSWSVDSVAETNATGAFMELIAVSNTTTSAITSLTISPSSGNFVQYSTFSLYGLAAVGTTPTIAPKAAGGSIYSDGTYWYHAFRTSGTFTPQVGLTADVLTIAGGGGGGACYAGGGGAGGFLPLTSQSLSVASHTVTIGGGGAGAAHGSYANGTVGVDSQLGTLTLVKGGGYGSPFNAGGAGGSGGGGGVTSGAGGAATSGQGFAGGNGSTTGWPTNGGGGGGGAAGAGVNGVSGGGNGGSASSAYSSWASATSTGVSGAYAGGGGGGNGGGSGQPVGTGGGGGATAGTYSANDASDATANTGSGGGGGGNVEGGGGQTGKGGNGGSGLVIIRYTIA